MKKRKKNMDEASEFFLSGKKKQSKAWEKKWESETLKVHLIHLVTECSNKNMVSILKTLGEAEFKTFIV